MKTRCLLTGCVILFAWPTARAAWEGPDDKQPATGCTCASFRAKGMGWCESCRKGLVYGCRLKSRAVYDVIIGRPLDKKKSVDCDTCKKSMKTNGVCKKCHLGYVNDRVFNSMFAHTLALGQPLGDKQMKCNNCVMSLREGRGVFCAKCGGGIVAGLFYKGRSTFDKAQRALFVVQLAIDKSAGCDHCATAILNDGECEKCGKKYNAGREVKD